jgi:hypothetical protein
VSIVYALGHCGFGYRVSSPNADTVLGHRATETDKNAMRTPAADDYVDQAGIGIYVRGHADFVDGKTKSFEWSFRLRASYRRCVKEDATEGEGVVLESGKSQTVDIAVNPGAIFGAERNLLQPLPQFQAFADADTFTGNDDGAVTFDELARVPLAKTHFADVRPIDPGAGEFADIDGSYVDRLRRVDGGWAAPVTLADYVYLTLFPKMLRFSGKGTCTIELSTRRGNG